MIDYSQLYSALRETPAKRWVDLLLQEIPIALEPSKNGNITKWNRILQSLPTATATSIDLNKPQVSLGKKTDLAENQRNDLELLLKQLSPWRKGPFSLFGIDIDTEWRSDLKWNRLLPHISPLRGKFVLDVGCGSGYHCFRMLGEGADRVIGIDPMLLFVFQFYSLKHFATELPVDVLPTTLDSMPVNLCSFDTVFSMGVLYHRRSPIDHLLQLRDALQPGGELILETLICDGEEGYSLTPESSYAGMKNIWFIPSTATLSLWLKRCGFRNIQLVDISQTSAKEQRATPWMQGRSLKDTLDPDNPTTTIEGLPTPKRGLFVAQRKKNG